MTLQIFFKLLPKLAKEINPKEADMVKCLNMMIHEYFEPLYRRISKKTLSPTTRRYMERPISDSEYTVLVEVAFIYIELE